MTPVGDGPDAGISSGGRVVRALVRRSRKARAQVTSTLLGRATITFGADAEIGADFRISSQGRVTVGDRVRIGRSFHCGTDLLVGDDTLISSSVSIVGNDHELDRPGITVFDAPRASDGAAVVLEGDNLLGYGCTIIGPCVIERGAVVGAGAVVTADRLKANGVYAGVPARHIRDRFGDPRPSSGAEGAP